MNNIQALLSDAAAAASPLWPKLAGALAIVVVAWLVARLLRSLIQRAGDRYGLDQRLGSVGLTATLAGVGSALVWLMALPTLLGFLDLQGLLTPVNALMTRLMAFIPNLMGAAVVLGVGLLVARILSQLVAGLLRAAGSETLAGKLGMQAALGEGGLAGIAGNVVFALMLLPTLVAALQPLGLDAVTLPLSRLLESVFNFVPKLLSASIVLGLGVLVGRLLSTLAAALLSGAGLDRLPQWLNLAGNTLAGRRASDWAASALMVAVLMAALTQACELLGLPVLTEAVSQIGTALLRLGMAALILLSGLLLANAAARSIRAQAAARARAQAQKQVEVEVEVEVEAKADTIAASVRGAILFFAAALALYQAGLPAVIVTIAFGAVVGGLAIGLAVALGVGGGPVAAQLLQRALERFTPSGPHRDAADVTAAGMVVTAGPAGTAVAAADGPTDTPDGSAPPPYPQSGTPQ